MFVNCIILFAYYFCPTRHNRYSERDYNCWIMHETGKLSSFDSFAIGSRLNHLVISLVYPSFPSPQDYVLFKKESTYNQPNFTACPAWFFHHCLRLCLGFLLNFILHLLFVFSCCLSLTIVQSCCIFHHPIAIYIVMAQIRKCTGNYCLASNID